MIGPLTGLGVLLQLHKEGLIVTAGAIDHMQKLMLQIMGAIARFERANIRERQREGIAKAKAAWKRYGRKATPDDDQVKEIGRHDGQWRWLSARSWR